MTKASTRMAAEKRALEESVETTLAASTILLRVRAAWQLPSIKITREIVQLRCSDPDMEITSDEADQIAALAEHRLEQVGALTPGQPTTHHHNGQALIVIWFRDVFSQKRTTIP